MPVSDCTLRAVLCVPLSQHDEDDEREGGAGGKHKKGKKGKRGKRGEDGSGTDSDDEPAETSEEYLTAAKKLVEEQKERNKHEFSDEGEFARQQHEGFRQGLYVRILLKRVPQEFTQNFRAQIPVVLGGLLPHELNMGFITARIKRHRWHRRILKSNDPLIFSIGWRRYQVRCCHVVSVFVVGLYLRSCVVFEAGVSELRSARAQLRFLVHRSCSHLSSGN
jgi:hypothetical protein